MASSVPKLGALRDHKIREPLDSIEILGNEFPIINFNAKRFFDEIDNFHHPRGINNPGSDEGCLCG